MADLPVAARQAEFAALDARLDAAGAADELAALKTDIGAFFKELEQEIADLVRLRDDIGKLVEKWKSLGAQSLTPAFATDRPTVRADHIGASTFVEKGWSRLSLGDYAGAEAALMRAIALSPDDPQALALLGWAQMLQEKYDDALMTFQQVLVREPINAVARMNVGYICLKKGIFGEAIEHLSRAIRLDSDKKATLYAHFYLGLVYLEREMFADAQGFFRQTIELGPNLIEAYFELGRAYWRNGQRDAALQAWRDGSAQNKFSPWGKKCADVLNRVQGGGEP
jgi:tetratricopeptide (TPR) repeat protein